MLSYSTTSYIFVSLFVIVVYFIYPYFRAKTSDKTYLQTYLLCWFLSIFGIIYLEYSIKKNKKTKKTNTLTVISMIEKGKLPSDELVEKSYFNDTHNLWNDYQEMREKWLKKVAEAEERAREAAEKQQAAIQERKRLQEEKDIKKYGKTAYYKAKNGQLFEGMDTYLLKIAKGSPDYVDERFTNKKYKHKYFYGKFTNQRGKDDYSFQVDIEGNKVVGWKDLKFNK